MFPRTGQREKEFEEVVLCHAPSLLRVARRLTSSSAADDLVQDCLLLAWRGFHQLERGTNGRAWLFRILFNTFYGQGRKLRRMPEAVPLSPQVSSIVPVVDDSIRLSNALDTLSAEQRAVLLLAAVEGFTCNEIAGIMSIPIGTVMSRLSRARQAMKAHLSAGVTPPRAAAAARKTR